LRLQTITGEVNKSITQFILLKKAREFVDLANKVYAIKDETYWMQRSKKLEGLLREASAFCPAGYKYEIEKALEIEQ
jgi:hypothetical protein